ncbi:hypothetical protein ACRE_057580 [Hapsidospora chrysogenum ATCC 11550]|uniref:Uncharacterized protein n=1 Tax=Hapsidospora chrysogenum (strain ATCC 11550 / CBS 779.69 / DSM 880 / IAM 14645 / JCM 23072 / IMI 49137) TaxID=857340 RepID=A0A086T2B4_HAPC1|nr:hypothetical protein ACRE_057580 [Hapsidospora chrysogenum ATCC 11550]
MLTLADTDWTQVRGMNEYYPSRSGAAVSDACVGVGAGGEGTWWTASSSPSCGSGGQVDRGHGATPITIIRVATPAVPGATVR